MGPTRPSHQIDKATALSRRVVQLLQRAVVRSVICVLVCTACASDDAARAGDSGNAADPGRYAILCAGASDTVVTRTGIGPVRLWMSIDRLRQHCAARDTAVAALQPDGFDVVVVGSDSTAILAMARKGGHQIVESITTVAPRYRTGRGVGVGSSADEIRASYGALCEEQRGDGVRIAVNELQGVSMTVSSLPLHARDGVTSVELGRIPGTARVTRVWIEGLASGCVAR